MAWFPIRAKEWHQGITDESYKSLLLHCASGFVQVTRKDFACYITSASGTFQGQRAKHPKLRRLGCLRLLLALCDGGY